MATVSFKITFNEVSKTLSLQDTTDYAGQGLTIAHCTGTITASILTSAGSTTFYSNLTPPDVVPATSRFSVHTIALPLDANGNVLSGQYTVGYSVLNTDAPLAFNFQLNTYIYQSPTATVCIEVTVDCGDSQVTSTDVTNYGSNVSVISRVHTLYPPPATGLSPYTGTLASLTVNGIYTKTWTSEVVSTVTYVNPDTTTTIKTFTGVKEFEVVCDTDLCKILCCLDNIKKTYDGLVCKNPTAAANFRQNIYDPVNENAIYFMLAQTCGDATKASCFYDKILEISGCGADCGCGSSSVPIPVIPNSNVNNITVVDSPDASIAVTHTTTGNTTTYHVQVSSAYQTIITNSYNTIVAAGTLISVTPSGTNPKTYTVAFTGSIPAVENHIEVLLKLSYSGGTPNAVLTPTYLIYTGAKFQAQGSNVWTVNTSQVQLATVHLTNFLTTPTYTNFTASTNLMRQDGSLSLGLAETIGVRVAYIETNGTGLYLTFYSPLTGANLTIFDLFASVNFADIYFKLSIYA